MMEMAFAMGVRHVHGKHQMEVGDGVIPINGREVVSSGYCWNRNQEELSMNIKVSLFLTIHFGAHSLPLS